MKKPLIALSMAALMATVTLAQSQTAKPEPQKPAAAPSKVVAMLQGTWVMTSSNGQDMAGGPEIAITITDTKYVQVTNGSVVERGSFTIDETKKPMTMDLNIAEGDDAGKKQLGVFEVTATTMRGKLNTPGETTRPTDFEVVGEPFFVFTAKKK
jgi:uncharacterized protein (TIGR03067 family)